MRGTAWLLLGVGVVVTLVGVVMGYVGGVRADESQPLGITASMFEVFFSGVALLAASVVLFLLPPRR